MQTHEKQAAENRTTVKLHVEIPMQIWPFIVLVDIRPLSNKDTQRKHAHVVQGSKKWVATHYSMRFRCRLPLKNCVSTMDLGHHSRDREAADTHKWTSRGRFGLNKMVSVFPELPDYISGISVNPKRRIGRVISSIQIHSLRLISRS